MTIGVEITEMSNKTNAANSRIVRGVAGLNMVNIGPPANYETIVPANVVETRPLGGVGEDGGAVRRNDGGGGVVGKEALN